MIPFFILLSLGAAHPAGAGTLLPEPVGLRADPEEGAVRLSWTCVPGAAGYLVYASEDGRTFDLVTGERVRSCAYLVTGVENGKRITYNVSAVSSDGAESRPSQTVTIAAGTAAGVSAQPVATAVGSAASSPSDRSGPTADTAPARRLVREVRRVGLLHEVTIRGLAGFGPNVTFHYRPQVTLETGMGLSLAGFKLGARGRWNLLRRNWTIFVAGGAMYDTGGGPALFTAGDPLLGTLVEYQVRPAAWAQAVFGIEGVTDSGFTFRADIGGAAPFGGPPVSVVSGSPTADQRTEMEATHGSGTVIGLAIGWTFGDRP